MIRQIATLALTLFSAATWAADRRPVLKRIGEVIVERYVYRDVAEKCVAHLMEDAARFDIDDPERFASAVTEELRRVCGDRHFELVVQRSEPAGAAPQDPSAWIEPLRRRNYDFNEVRRLAGNVGYLELRSFPPPEVAATAAAAAMSFLSSSDAVILDLRRNSGGTGDMVTFLATYFFDGVTALTNTERRPQGTITQDRTLPWVPGPRMSTQDVFILTSRATFSAAEALAFALQSLKRATVVGEGTRGGANAGRYIEVSPEFRLFVSNAHATSATTGKSWDKVGVQPDIAVDAADALETAHAEAVRRLGIKTKDEQRKRELHWILQSLAAHVEVADAQMRELAGEYERYTVRLHRGRLLYSYDGGPERPLIPIGEGLFAIDGVESRRVELRSEGVLVVHSSDGMDEVLRRK
jgi:hypothetical protein